MVRERSSISALRYCLLQPGEIYTEFFLAGQRGSCIGAPTLSVNYRFLLPPTRTSLLLDSLGAGGYRVWG